MDFSQIAVVTFLFAGEDALPVEGDGQSGGTDHSGVNTGISPSCRLRSGISPPDTGGEIPARSWARHPDAALSYVARNSGNPEPPPSAGSFAQCA